MSAVLDFFNQIASSALPALVSVLVAAFYFFGKRTIGGVKLEVQRLADETVSAA